MAEKDNKKCAIPFRDISKSIEDIAGNFGYVNNKNHKNAGFRGFTENRGYLAFINPDQPDDGVYNGLSFVVFPIGYKKHEDNDDESEFLCVVSIGIGRGDVGSDEELASLPYLRRCFLRLTDGGQENYEQQIFIKNSFADVTTESVDLFKELNHIKTGNAGTPIEESGETSNTESVFDIDLSFIESYKNLLPASRIVKFKKSDCEVDLSKLSQKKHEDNSFRIIVSWLAQYAKIRNWDFRGDRLSNKNKAIGFTERRTDKDSLSELSEIYDLLDKRHFVVLQGAPGVGKTRMANLIGSNLKELKDKGLSTPKNVIDFETDADDQFFIQFHAETTYADFIGGIRPKLVETKDHLEYEYVEGTLTKAIKTAKEALDDVKDKSKAKKYLLIIDEINRANLANVLGPVFYLFERANDERKGCVKIELNSGATIDISSIPENLYVIATMNTADRSLAVVDFALRRRFAWYTLEARKIDERELKGGTFFHEKAFNKIAELFEKYASDEELNLQPGSGYFILDKKGDNMGLSGQEDDQEEDEFKKEMGERLTYEIMPLMKEYFTEGLLIKAQDEFANYYYKMTKKYMYR